MRAIIFILVIASLFSHLFAKITPKELKEGEYEIVVIQKGDTLWDLAGRYVGKCYQWPEFEKYNQFTDPHWIYPGEKLAIGIKDGRLVIRKAEELDAELRTKIKESEAEIARLKEEIESLKQAPPQKEIVYDKGREERLLSEREKLERELFGLKGEAESIRKGMDALAKKLSQTEERLDLTEDRLTREKQLTQKKEKELQGVREEKEQIAKEEKTQRRYKEILAISAFVGIIIANSLR